MLRILLVRLACSNTLAATPSSKPVMQPLSMQKGLQTLLHCPSCSALLVDVLHGPYPLGARPAYLRAVHLLIVVVTLWCHTLLSGIDVVARKDAVQAFFHGGLGKVQYANSAHASAAHHAPPRDSDKFFPRLIDMEDQGSYALTPAFQTALVNAEAAAKTELTRREAARAARRQRRHN